MIYQYINNLKILLTSSNDGYVRGWKLSNESFKIASTNNPLNDLELVEH